MNKHTDGEGANKEKFRPSLHPRVWVTAGVPEGPNGFTERLRLMGSFKRRQQEDPDYITVPRFPETAAPPKTG